METKTYYAKELSAILDQIKDELGEEAIIVRSRRTRKKGVLGLFQKPVYEVVVNYDPDEIGKQPEPSPKQSNPLSGFGKDADRRLAAAATAAAAKAQKAREKRVEEMLPPVSPDAFAELIQMADALEAEENTPDKIQPAWITPSAKLGAYVSMRHQDPHNEQQQLQAQAAWQPPAMEQVIVQAPMRQAAPQAAFVPATSVQAEAYTPPQLMVAEAQTESALPQQGMQAAEKRKRGRPRKTLESAAGEALAAPVRGGQGTVNEQGEAIVSRLDVVEQMLRTLMEDMRAGAQEGEAPAGERENAAGAAAQAAQEAQEAERIRDSLLAQDVDLPVAEELVRRAEALKKRSNIQMEQAIEHVLREVMGKPKYLRGSTKTARTVMLIGPTGVGKTTTLVKLAAGCLFERKANVAIINADVFRVGAQDQLKAYAKILDVPLKTIYETKELKDAVNGFADRDFIFIDTCGKASTDKEYQNEIRELLNTGKVQDVYLVVSSTTSGRVCRQIVESYGFIKQYKTILTKLDESGSIGGAVNLSYYSGQPLSYVTIGQNVPDDISKVDVEDVIVQLLR